MVSNYESPLFPEYENLPIPTQSPKKKAPRVHIPSSARAREEHKTTGRFDSDRNIAFRSVVNHPGCTSEELAGDDYRWLMALRKRLSDLLKAKKIYFTQAGKEDKRWWVQE